MRLSTARVVVVTAAAIALAACGEDAPRTPPAPRWREPAPAAADGAVAWPPYTILGRRAEAPRGLTWAMEAEGCPLPSGEANRLIAEALELWSDTGVVSFTEAGAGEDPALLFLWKDGSRDDGSPFLDWDGGIAHAGARGVQAVVHFNRSVTWEGDGGLSLLATAAHEVGHVLGIGHSPQAGALMHGAYDRTHRRLTAADLAALHTIYGGGDAAEADLHPCRCGPEGVPEPCAPAVRGLAIPGIAVSVLDADGDGRAELLSWPRGDAAGDLLIIRFDEQARVRRTVGPIPGFVTAGRSLLTGTEIPGGEPVLLHVAGDGRYAARRFDEQGLPAKVRPAGPLRLASGEEDADADGLLEIPEPAVTPLPQHVRGYLARPEGWTVIGATDLDGDREPDTLLEGPRDDRGLAPFRWHLSLPNRLSKPWQARETHLGDLDGDGRLDVLIRGWSR